MLYHRLYTAGTEIETIIEIKHVAGIVRELVA
jgi:hypothetical protein